MKKWLAGLLVALVVVPLAGGFGAAAASPVPMPPELWLMNADGSGQRLLYPSEPQRWSSVSDHDWSPDGSEIAFLADGALRIHSLVTESERLVVQMESATYVDWSPTGDWIAIGSAWGTPRGLFLVRPDGTELHHIGPDGQAVAPRWSPDGSRVAAVYFYGPYDPVDLTVVTVEGDVQMLASDLSHTTPSWSPDGMQLAYADKEHRLSVVTGDGSVTKITPAETAYSAVDWNPDGSKIAYSGPGGIAAVNPDGSGKIELLDNGYTLRWDPAGSQLAGATGNDIFRVAKDGTGVTNLTNTDGRQDTQPRWSPDATKIAYISTEKSYVPPDETIDRTISLVQRRHLVLKGRVRDVGEHSASCTWTSTQVILQRRSSGLWNRIARVNTGEGGRFRVKVADRPGRYRALVREKVFYQPGAGNQITCTAARSAPVTHRH